MKQITPDNLIAALFWIQTERHNEVGAIYNDKQERVGVFFRNYHETLRVMDRHEWSEFFHQLTIPQKRKHDDRMFGLTFYGRQHIAGLYDPKEHP